MKQEVTTKVADVLMHHMTALKGGQLDEVMTDYTNKSVLMSPERTFRGLAEIRAFFQAAIAGAPPEMLTTLTLIHQDINDDVVYIAWKAEPFVKMGTDTFVIQNGKIITQTFLMVS